MKLHFNQDFSRNRLSAFRGWPEFPASDGVHRFLIEPFSHSADHRDMAGTSVGLDNQTNDARALVFRKTRLFGVLRVRIKNGLRRSHTGFRVFLAANSVHRSKVARQWASN